MSLPDPLPSVLDTMRAIAPVGSAPLAAVIDKLSPAQQAALAQAVAGVDTKAGGYSFFGVRLSWWVAPARAWMLLKLRETGMLTVNPPGFDPYKDQLPGLVAEVAGLTPAAIVDTLARALGGQHHIALIAAAQSDAARRTALATWNPNNFTPPAAHKARGEWKHLVVGLRRETDIGLANSTPARKDYVQQHMSAFITADEKYLSAKHYLTDPSILTKSLISASVLTRQKVTTYAKMHFGFVLHVPTELIAFAAPKDLDMGFDKTTRPDMLAGKDGMSRMALISDSFIQGLANLYARPLPTLASVIADTPVEGHNEIAVVGSIGAAAVRVTGLFVKTTDEAKGGGEPKLAKEHDVDEATWEISKVMKKAASDLGVPIIRIPDPKLEAGATSYRSLYPKG